MNLLPLLKSPNLHLSKSERKVCEAVLAAPEDAIHTPIAVIAKQAGVSEPTVNRFCRSMGCKGYPDFKVKLAKELSNGQPLMTRDVTPSDSLSTLAEKIFESTRATLHTTQSSLDIPSLEMAVNALAQAKCIVFFGLGASGSVAMDAQHKFFRFNTPVIAHTDILNQRMSCSAMGQQDTAVFISYTGRTKAIIENAEVAKETGATVLGITDARSPLAKQCDIVLPVDTPEDTDLYTPMTSRINHLVLIDVLATAVAVKRGPQFSNHLKKIKDSLLATRKHKR
ncbi:transcriptional regulator HexR [Porticoccus sp. W117]|uniref:transcriptional regulator HexR n=1 Tax=Porticoccus sp. W117 TaxID=3054777 RepID=UPI002592ABE5|nr:transcriptional regulator HexR [Porticoccus sp. W117]MDM3870047.1 transcriptional regulator HexR [Porticoccus sp. W117]